MPSKPSPAPAVLTSLGFDAAVVIAFAAAGRSNHAEGMSILGIADTAWPFLVGLALAGWLGLVRGSLAARTWWQQVIGLALPSVAVGMILRLLTGDGAAPAFVVVATLTLTAGFALSHLAASHLRPTA
ncbi:DUF3054 domain-containing protein [Ornithinimicrobium sp. Arc0846-15]|nr:DUF3054 domain-containing protein [Ornithinimicrobium laminariae]